MGYRNEVPGDVRISRRIGLGNCGDERKIGSVGRSACARVTTG